MDIKYLTDGTVVKLIQALHGGKFLVSTVYEEYSEYNENGHIHEIYGEPYIVDNIYDTAPVKKLNQEIKQNEGKLQSIKDEIQKLSKHKSLLNSEIEQIINDNKYVKQVLQLINKEIKYIAIKNSNAWNIKKFEDALKEDNSSYSKPKLISLFGNSNGNLTWNINRYSDGSGSWQEVEFFNTEEDAKIFIQKKLNQMLENILVEFNANAFFYLFQNCKEYKVPIPSVLIEKYKQQKIKDINERQNYHQKEFDNYSIKIQSDITEIESYQPSN